MEPAGDIVRIRNLLANEKIESPPSECCLVLAGNPKRGCSVHPSLSFLGSFTRAQFTNHGAGEILPRGKTGRDSGKRLGIAAEPGSNHYGRSGPWPPPQVRPKLL